MVNKADLAQAVVESWDLGYLINYAIGQLVDAYDDDPELFQEDKETMFGDSND